MSQGYLAFVLHSHLPYVLSHGRWPHGTDWLCEAAAETYLPLIRIIDELVEERLEPKLTIGLSPVLCEQLADEQFKSEFKAYLDQKIEAAGHDAEEFYKHDQQQMLSTAHHWEKFYSETKEQFKSIGEDILPQFKRLQDRGYLEIITCGATHGYYPLLSRDESLQVQTKAAVKNYIKHFDRQPRGIWLPECAYRPGYKWRPPVEIRGKKDEYDRKGTEEFLSENGIDFFIIDSVLLKGGQSVGVYIERFDALKQLWQQFEKAYQPPKEDKDKTPREVYYVATGRETNKPVAIFSRDPETGILVWSGEHGYPGDGHYLDFHKKRFPGGLRYWAVTSAKSDLADKVEYNFDSVAERLNENSDHFIGKVDDTLTGYNKSTDQKGILVAPYDAELFGHWWYEGPLFLKEVLRKACLSKNIELSFLGEDLDRRKPSEIVSIPEGSWGQGNNHYIWLNQHTEWTWKRIYESEERMCRLAKAWSEDDKFKNDSDLTEILKQAGREMMLMSASDWQFLISTWAARDYAELRLSEHYEDFKRIAELVEKLMRGEKLSASERAIYQDCRARDTLFEELELNWFAKVDFPAGT